MNLRRARWRVVATAVTLSVQFMIMLTPIVSFAQTSGTQRPPVQRGQEYYEQSRFDEAITLLRDLVDRDQLSGETLQKARELLARSYVKKGYPVQAKEMFKAILRVTPDWRPDPIKVPPDETAVFDQALKEFQTEQVAPPPPPPPPVKQETAAPPVVSKPAPAKPKMAPVTVPSLSGPKKSNKTWLYVAGGAVLVGVVAAVAGGGGGKSEGGSTPRPALAGFPNPPTP